MTKYESPKMEIVGGNHAVQYGTRQKTVVFQDTHVKTENVND